ncbi:MAG TPA: hypothetical protein VEB66_17925 [Opitutaceae bacterium]|nr:hypothetical protein [Opitutaceae bacterium]
MTVLGYGQLLLMFVVTVFGLGWPIARRLLEDPLERLCAAAVAGLSCCFAFAFVLYAAGLSLQLFGLAPLAGALALALEHRSVRALWSAPEARTALWAWAALALATQALLATVRSYSGGAWGGDWLEHHQRALFFREHWALDFNFIGDYLLPARPPLVNVVTAGFHAVGDSSFATGQVVSALWSSLVFLPAALLCRMAGGGARTLLGLAALLALNPSFLQNTTFAWTKLPAAFFVLAGAHFLLSAIDRPETRARFAVATLALTAGVLAHYSAGPFCLVLVAWWLFARLRRREFAVLGREAAVGLAVAPPLLALWFGWSLRHYGVAGTFLSNSTAIEFGPTGGLAQAAKVAGNVWATLVPHPLRNVDPRIIAFGSGAERFRHQVFMIYQVNLFGLLGSAGAAVLAVAAWRGRAAWRAGPPAVRPAAVIPGVAAAVILGVAVHGAPDAWGLAHICLQPVAIAGLAVLAARLPGLGRAIALVVVVALTWDLTVGIGLHYWLQAKPPHPDWSSVRDLTQLLVVHGTAALNAGLKAATGVRFLRDCLPAPVAPCLALASIAAAVLAARSSRALTPPPSPS